MPPSFMKWLDSQCVSVSERTSVIWERYSSTAALQAGTHKEMRSGEIEGSAQLPDLNVALISKGLRYVHSLCLTEPPCDK